MKMGVCQCDGLSTSWSITQRSHNPGSNHRGAPLLAEDRCGKDSRDVINLSSWGRLQKERDVGKESAGIGQPRPLIFEPEWPNLPPIVSVSEFLSETATYEGTKQQAKVKPNAYFQAVSLLMIYHLSLSFQIRRWRVVRVDEQLYCLESIWVDSSDLGL